MNSITNALLPSLSSRCSFIFDYGLGRRVKLFDPVSFPEVLDMAPFLHTEDADKATGHTSDPSLDPLLYDLYAVLVHYGSAMGGHYFAYIKVSGGGGQAICLRVQ